MYRSWTNWRRRHHHDGLDGISGCGTYGIHYLPREEVAKKALGANRKEDAVYGYTMTDERGIDLQCQLQDPLSA
jgi:hypothetical protein